MYKIDFSIVMPAFNAELTLAESIQSVLGQTLGSFELLIVDDCSTDGTRDLILSFAAADQRIRPIFLQENGGVASARNAAIRCAEGRYIAFLDADDIWLENKLVRQLDAFSQGADVVYSDFVRFHKDGSEKIVVSPDGVDFKKLLRGNCIGNLTAAYDVSKLGKFFQESIGHEDYFMWLQIFRKGVKSKRVPEKLAMYRVLNTSVSGNKIKAVGWTWNIYRNKIGLSLFSSCYHFVIYVFGAIMKRI
ncbi:glycosyltransferase family 2 protein [Pseudomonas proteolytica]|uniref:glycosyltransferase family 2 protein n=1 Tax=Pseudomonas proteolytica TaxID=219574 RepID=UPI00147411C0|nr:glycosyltransferase family 2 protein [Pseudomonas proteolytica]NMZ34903.1 glycosyltransferase family 2 protein [Pseudomonas proteolytica]